MTKNLNLRSLYLYLVCLVTLVIFIFGTIFTIQRTVDLIVDDGYYQTLEDFRQRYYMQNSRNQEEEVEEISEEEIKERYKAYEQEEANRRRNRNIKNLSYSFSAMLVGGGFWIYHWRKIQEDQ
ncbi:MAG: hypothetical protein JJT76_12175 [Clostridiaceae bacterium]|nr:hypothetical protein [Clostridiaceae bacterium]